MFKSETETRNQEVKRLSKSQCNFKVKANYIPKSPLASRKISRNDHISLARCKGDSLNVNWCKETKGRRQHAKVV